MEKGQVDRIALPLKLSPEEIAFDIRVNYALSLMGKYVKYGLTELEKRGLLDPTTRKIFLDSFGDCRRELERTLKP